MWFMKISNNILYTITPEFTYSVTDPNYVAPAPAPVVDEDAWVEPVPVAEIVVDEDLALMHSLTSAPDDATKMVELGDYVYSLYLQPDTGNYVLNNSSVTVEVVPREIQIYVRETKGYDGVNP